MKGFFFNSLLCLLLSCITLVLAVGNNKPLLDSKKIKDRQHIEEHLKEQVDVENEKLDDENMVMHYFKLHDYDNNGKLDGLEIFKAMYDYTQHNNERVTETKFAEWIDQTLKDDDLNRDGFIDYTEYLYAYSQS